MGQEGLHRKPNDQRQGGDGSRGAAFRTTLRRQRWLVLADGFYEWQKVGASRRPMRIFIRTAEPFAFAGLWETWRDSQGIVVSSCTIITTEVNNGSEIVERVRPSPHS